MIVEYYIIQSEIPNYTKLAFSSLNMIKNDPISQPIKQGMIGMEEHYIRNHFRVRPRYAG